MNRQFQERLLSLTLFCVLLSGRPVMAQVETPGELMCPNADIWGAKLITDICWSCLFPIKLLGVLQFGTGNVPAESSNESICFCDGELGIPDIGFTVGMWAPARLIEIVRKPYCSPTLGGITLNESFRLWGMKDGADGQSSSNQFYNYHYFAFPLYEILELVVTPECNPGGFSDFDLMYISEIDPTWVEDELSVFTQPEVAVAANPLLQAACPVDCAASTLSGPIDSMWWCAGCWGNLYPFTGNVPSGGSPPRVSSLLSTRALASLHRRGLAWRTVGDEALCGGAIYPMLPKQQYRMSMLFPLAEADNSTRIPTPSTNAPTGVVDIDDYEWTQQCCHNIGVPTFLWGEWRNIPAVGEDFVYVLWRWTDCCVR